MKLSEKRIREIAFLYLKWKLEREGFSLQNFQDRVTFTCGAIGIPEEEGMAFAKEILTRLEKRSVDDALSEAKPVGSA